MIIYTERQDLKREYRNISYHEVRKEHHKESIQRVIELVGKVLFRDGDHFMAVWGSSGKINIL